MLLKTLFLSLELLIFALLIPELILLLLLLFKFKLIILRLLFPELLFISGLPKYFLKLSGNCVGITCLSLRLIKCVAT